MKDYVVFSISTHKTLAKDFAKFWNCQLGKVAISKFPDGEILIKPSTDVKDKDVILIEDTAKKPNEHVVQILLLLDALQRSNARTITLIIPYLGYSRQERISYPGEPLSAQVFANIIETGKYDRLLSFDLHHPDISKFFTRGVKNIPTTEIFVNYYNNYFYENGIDRKDVIVVGPDHGSNARADSLAFNLRGVKRIVLEKVRQSPTEIEHLEVNGDVKDKVCIIVDDIISTGSTMVSATKLLKKKGAKAILVCASHGVFAKGAIEAIKKAGVKDIVVSNTIEQDSSSGVNTVDILPIIIENI